MKKDGDHESTYVRKVQEDTKRYVQSLLDENKTLRSLLARMESEKLRLEEQVLVARQQMDVHRRLELRLQQQVAEMEVNNERFAERSADIEQQNSNLANLYVASYRLHGTLDREQVLEVIQEILINLVGSEEIAIFEVDSERLELSLAASCGVDVERFSGIPLGSGVIGGVAQTGEPYFKGQSGNGDGSSPEDDLTACIALKVDGTVMGAIAVFRLLQQKAGLESVDHELFDLLATHAATALYSSNLYGKLAAEMTVSP